MLVGLASCSISLTSPPSPSALFTSIIHSCMIPCQISWRDSQIWYWLVIWLDHISSHTYPLCYLPSCHHPAHNPRLTNTFGSLFENLCYTVAHNFHKCHFLILLKELWQKKKPFSTLQFSSTFFTIFFKLSLQLFWKKCLDIFKNGCGTFVYSTNRS